MFNVRKAGDGPRGRFSTKVMKFPRTWIGFSNFVLAISYSLHLQMYMILQSWDLLLSGIHCSFKIMLFEDSIYVGNLEIGLSNHTVLCVTYITGSFILPLSPPFPLWLIFLLFPIIAFSGISVLVTHCWCLSNSLCQSGHGLVRSSWPMGPEWKTAETICKRVFSL